MAAFEHVEALVSVGTAADKPVTRGPADRYPRLVRIGILVGGALASWALFLFPIWLAF